MASATAVFDSLQTLVVSQPQLAQSVSASFIYRISQSTWLVDLKSKVPVVRNLSAQEAESMKTDCIITIGEQELIGLVSKKLSAMDAFMTGKIKIEGDFMAAQKLQALLERIDLSQAKPTASSSDSRFKSEAMLNNVRKALESKKPSRGVFLFVVKKGEEKKSWVIDLKNKQVREGGGEADCTIHISDQDLVELFSGKLEPQMAFMTGKIKIEGDIMLAQKLETLVASPRSAL
jgi:putative sterol carrier protein